MAHKKKHRAPVPPANQPKAGPGAAPAQEPTEDQETPQGAPFHEQDPKRRLGNYGGEGEHPYQQPGGLNDANR